MRVTVADKNGGRHIELDGEKLEKMLAQQAKDAADNIKAAEKEAQDLALKASVFEKLSASLSKEEKEALRKMMQK